MTRGVSGQEAWVPGIHMRCTRPWSLDGRRAEREFQIEKRSDALMFAHSGKFCPIWRSPKTCRGHVGASVSSKIALFGRDLMSSFFPLSSPPYRRVNNEPTNSWGKSRWSFSLPLRAQWSHLDTAWYLSYLMADDVTICVVISEDLFLCFNAYNRHRRLWHAISGIFKSI